MFEQEQHSLICFACDSEFTVHTPYEMEQSVSFCPFCGSEIEGEEDDLEEDSLDEDDFDSSVFK